MLSRVALVGLVALGVGAAPAQGQERGAATDPAPRLSISLAGGAFVSSDWSDLVLVGGDAATTDRLGRVLLPDLAAGAGPLGELSVTYWRDRLGVRFHAGYARSCVASGPGCASETFAPPGSSVFDVPAGQDGLDVWLLDAAAVMELETPFRSFRPYLLLGGGITVYDPDDGVRAITPGFVELGGRTGRIVFDDDGDVVVVEEGPVLARINRPGFEVLPSLVAGIGTEFRLPLRAGGVGLRLEVSDNIGRSPLQVSLTRLESDFGFDFFDDSDDEEDDEDEVEFDFGIVHNLRATVGVSWTVPLPRRAGGG